MTAFSKFSGYILLKWTLFYIYQFAGNHTKWNWDKVNGEGLFLAAFMLLALPLIELFVLFFPLQFALKQKGWMTISVLTAVFGLEFIIGWIAANQYLEAWMIVEIALGIGLFWLMYRKQLAGR